MLLTTTSTLLFLSLLVYGPAAATFWSIFNSNVHPPQTYSASSSSSNYGYSGLSSSPSFSYMRVKRHIPRLVKSNQLKRSDTRPMNNNYNYNSNQNNNYNNNNNNNNVPTALQLPCKTTLKNQVDVFNMMNSKLLNHTAQYNKLIEDEIKRQQITWLSIPGWDSMVNKTTSIGGSIYPKLFIPADMTLKAMMAMRKKLENFGPSAMASLPSMPKLRIGIALPARPILTTSGTYGLPQPVITVAPIVNNYARPYSSLNGKQETSLSSSSSSSSSSSFAGSSSSSADKSKIDAKINVDEKKLTASLDSASVSGNSEMSAKTSNQPSSSSSISNEPSVSAKNMIGMPSQASGEVKSSLISSKLVSGSSSLSAGQSEVSPKTGLSPLSSPLDNQPTISLLSSNDPLASTKVEVEAQLDGKSAEADQDDSSANGRIESVSDDNNSESKLSEGNNDETSSSEDQSAMDASILENLSPSNV